MCEVLKLSKSIYYIWLKQIIGARALSNKVLDEKIETIYTDHRGNYGCPRVYEELQASNVKCSKNRVYRRMQSLKLKAKTKKQFKVTFSLIRLTKNGLGISPIYRLKKVGCI